MTSWLKCNSITKGMLPGEFAVVTSTSDGKEISLFAPAKFVLEARRLMEVTIIEKQANQALISLPAAPLEIQSKTVTVSTTELIAA